MRLYGWYASAFAAEPFVVSAASTYIPLLLAELARAHGVRPDDLVSPCEPLVGAASPQCVTKVLYWYVDSTSLPLYTMSATILGQVVFMLSSTGFVDRTPHAKLELVLFAIFGAVSTILLGGLGATTYIRPISRVVLVVGLLSLLVTWGDLYRRRLSLVATVGAVAALAVSNVTSSGFFIPAALFVVACSCFGAMSVCGNAFLPKLAERTYFARKARFLANSDRFQGAFSPPPPLTEEDEVTAVSNISTRISSAGAAWGYLAALLAHVTTIMMVRAGWSLSAVIAFIGWWWLVCQPVVVYGLDTSQLFEEYYAHCELPTLLSHGWVQLIEVLRHVQRLKDIALFLVGWFLLSDGLNTINSTAILFARVNLNMGTPQLALISLITIVFALFGSLFIGPRLSQRYAMVQLALLGSVIPLYGLVGFLSPYIGLKRPWEMYTMAVWYGCVLGSLQTVARALYSVLIPEAGEATFFAFYAVTGKGSSILGPVVTGLITDYTHDIRYGFYFLLAMILLGAYTFSYVDFDRGRQDASEYNLLDYSQVSVSLPADEL